MADKSADLATRTIPPTITDTSIFDIEVSIDQKIKTTWQHFRNSIPLKLKSTKTKKRHITF